MRLIRRLGRTLGLVSLLAAITVLITSFTLIIAPPAQAATILAPVATAPPAPPKHVFSNPTRNGHFLPLDAVVRIHCKMADGGDTGTGTVYQTGRVLTAAHVVRDAKSCTVDGQAAEVVWQDAGLDMAILTTDTTGYPVIPLSCSGVEPDKLYLAVGYAEGEDFSIDKLWWAGGWTSPLIEGQKMPHMAEMQGYLFQGQSGGPVLDLDGSQIGMVNASAQGAPMSLVRTLTDSPLCPKTPPAPAAVVVPTVKTPKLKLPSLPSLLGPSAPGGIVILTPPALN